MAPCALLGLNLDLALVTVDGGRDRDGRAIDETSPYGHQVAKDDGPGASGNADIPCSKHLKRRDRSIGQLLNVTDAPSR
jgi:hypothetical protein